MTQLERAQRGEDTPEVRAVAEAEGLEIETVRKRTAEGQIVIPANSNRCGTIIGIGKGLSTKVNASIGSSTDIADIEMEVQKAMTAEKYGADFICYVTPSEHLGLPYPEDVREGVIASRIAAHVGDMIKLGKTDKDKAMSKARRDMKWGDQFSICLDEERARDIKAKRGNGSDHSCTMCGSFCANDILKGMFESDMAGSDKR